MTRVIVLTFLPLMTLFLLLSSLLKSKDKSRDCLAAGISIGAIIVTFLLFTIWNPSWW